MVLLPWNNRPVLKIKLAAMADLSNVRKHVKDLLDTVRDLPADVEDAAENIRDAPELGADLDESICEEHEPVFNESLDIDDLDELEKTQVKKKEKAMSEGFANRSIPSPVKMEYMNLLREAQAANQNPKSVSMDDITEQAELSNKLIGRVTNIADTVLDSTFCQVLFDTARQRSQEKNLGGLEFDPIEFCERWNEVFADDSLQIEPLSQVTPNTPFFDCGRLLPRGDEPAEPKEKRARQGPTQQIAPVVTAKEVSKETVSQEDTETAREVQHFMKYLKRNCKMKQGPVNMFEFCLHPTDFGQTVMNLFHCSFAVKDGFVKITHIDRVPHIEVLPKESLPSRGIQRSCIYYMDKPMWRKLVELHGLKEPMVPIFNERQS